ncbi:hypothetical protein OIU84_001883 [Salix udensis]|uniref:Uncharacterized protein n=1 Tax=Salix udensis TaxID=889485 RepID=A0AAD6K9I6_9ROSI|nr:hypothetical protein OIU84_001883 [Salix udensis]
MSNTDIAHILCGCPLLLGRSLENHITPNFNLLSDLLPSDNKVIAAARNDPFILFRHGDRYLKPFITLLQDHGVPRTQIASLICNWPRSIGVCLNHFRKCVEKVREMGYDPCSAEFTRSVVVLSQLGKAGWERKNKLIAKKPNLNTLFVYSEKLFLEKFVNCFDEAPQLLKLYRDQSDLAK